MKSNETGSPLARVLLVDDEANILRSFRYCLEGAGYHVATAGDADGAEMRVQEEVFDLCFLDLRLGDSSGIEVMPRLKQHAPWLKVVIVTAENSVNSAVSAIRAGAEDYLVKPCSPEQLRAVAARQARARMLERRISALEQESVPSIELSSSSPAMARALETARQVADTDASVLITGESGTGKGVLARAIHGWSGRSERHFVTVNCPALSPELMASELFGHRRGAFTGATDNKLGRVDQAEGGSLFLDEIGDFPLSLQPRLLRFIQDREYERVGDPATRRADVRIIAATNQNLQAMMREGNFREDLYYRLNVICIDVPPLRERIEDITPLAQQFLQRYASAYRRPARGFTRSAAEALRAYAWPGNVRELQNVIERSVITGSSPEIDAHQLGVGEESGEVRGRPRAGDPLSLDELERAHIVRVVASSPSLDNAARMLGIDVSTLYRKRKQYGI